MAIVLTAPAVIGGPVLTEAPAAVSRPAPAGHAVSPPGRQGVIARVEAALHETHVTQSRVSRPAPGVELIQATLADPASHPQWTVTVQAPATDFFTGSLTWNDVGSASWAQHTVASLAADGFTARTRLIEWPDYLDTPRGVMGTRVRVGNFAAETGATREAAELTADGFHPAVEWEGFDAQSVPDAEQIHAVIVNPNEFPGHVEAIHGTAVAERETVSAQARQVGSLAAVNGGLFTIASQLTDVAGTQTSLGVYSGKIQDLSNGSDADLVLDGRRPARIMNLASTAYLHVGDAEIRVLGLNRQPGAKEDCGVPGFEPTGLPHYGPVCTGPNDMVCFTAQFGRTLPTGPGVQALMDAHGRVVSVGPRGGPVPAGGAAVQAIGMQATWLRRHVRAGATLHLREQLREQSGRPFHLNPHTSIAGGVPVLLRDGRPAIDAVREGVFDPRGLYLYGFSAQRHARTVAGVDRQGRLILVTVDGIPGISEGLTLTEEATLMQAFGAVDAMNLDGGGSTTFAVNGQVVNQPSDATGERPVGDSIQVVPAPR